MKRINRMNTKLFGLKHTNQCISTILALALTTLLFLPGCNDSSGGSGGVTTQNDSDGDTVLGNLTFRAEGATGIMSSGKPPVSSTNPDSPSVTSAPESIPTALGSTERIDIAYDSPSEIEKVFFTLEDASSHVRLDTLDGEGVTMAQTGSETVGVSVFIDVPSDLGRTYVNLRVLAENTDGLVSEVTEINIDVASQNGESSEREVLFHTADYLSSELALLNVDTGDVEEIGNTGFSLTDIGFLDGQLYGVEFENLIKIDADTADSVKVGSLGLSGANALVAYEGLLYTATTSGEVATVNEQTGEAEIIGNLGEGARSSGDLIVHDGKLLVTVKRSDLQSDGLAEVDPETGSATLIDEIGFDNVYGLATLRGQLLGLTEQGDYLLINGDTGGGTFISSTSAAGANGAAQ